MRGRLNGKEHQKAWLLSCCFFYSEYANVKCLLTQFDCAQRAANVANCVLPSVWSLCMFILCMCDQKNACYAIVAFKLTLGVNVYPVWLCVDSVTTHKNEQVRYREFPTSHLLLKQANTLSRMDHRGWMGE